METETRAAFARRHRVQRSTVTKWEAKGLVALTDDDLVDIAETEKRLAGRPQNYRGGRSKGPVDPKSVAAIESASALDVQLDAFQLLLREVGKITACAAVAAGAPMRVAHALERMIPIDLAFFAIDQLPNDVRGAVSLSDWPFEGLGFGEGEPDWAALARQAGEPVDMEGWDSYLAKIDTPSR